MPWCQRAQPLSCRVQYAASTPMLFGMQAVAMPQSWYQASVTQETEAGIQEGTHVLTAHATHVVGMLAIEEHGQLFTVGRRCCRRPTLALWNELGPLLCGMWLLYARVL